MGRIILEGRPPFNAPVTQRATASSQDGIVLVTLYQQFEDQGPFATPIRTPLTAAAARGLAASLIRAAGQTGRVRVRPARWVKVPEDPHLPQRRRRGANGVAP
jgi:hypothetical protein